MKIRKYKKGDKVILLKDYYGYCKNDIGVVIEKNRVVTAKLYYDIYVKDRKSTSGVHPNVAYLPNDIEYIYEKPLKKLFHKIKKINSGIFYATPKDLDTIYGFINQENTLTIKEIKKCALIWEKYNKNEK